MKTHWANKIRASTVIWKSARSVWNMMIILMELTETSQQADLILSHQAEAQLSRWKWEEETVGDMAQNQRHRFWWAGHGPGQPHETHTVRATGHNEWLLMLIRQRSNWWNWLRELWDPAQGWFAFVDQILDGFELINNVHIWKWKKSKCTT